MGYNALLEVDKSENRLAAGRTERWPHLRVGLEQVYLLAPRPPALPSPRRAAILGFLVAIAGHAFINQAAWSFAERSGTNAGLAVAETGGWLAGSNLVTVLGSLLAAWVASRVISIVPLVVGLLTTGLTCAAQVGAESSWAFQVPVLLNGLAFGFAAPVDATRTRRQE